MVPLSDEVLLTPGRAEPGDESEEQKLSTHETEANPKQELDLNPETLSDLSS